MSDIRFTDEHEWIRVDGDTGTVVAIDGKLIEGGIPQAELKNERVTESDLVLGVEAEHVDRLVLDREG